MSKKGGKKDSKDKKPSNDEPEWQGPNIYDELASKKPVTDLLMDLDAPISIIAKENIEFEVLTDRL